VATPRCPGSTAPTATIAVRTTVATLSVMMVPAEKNCSGSSATTAPAASPAVLPKSLHPTTTVMATAARLTIALIGLMAHSLSVNQRIGARKVRYPGVRTYIGDGSAGERLNRPVSTSALAGSRYPGVSGVLTAAGSACAIHAAHPTRTTAATAMIATAYRHKMRRSTAATRSKPPSHEGNCSRRRLKRIGPLSSRGARGCGGGSCRRPCVAPPVDQPAQPLLGGHAALELAPEPAHAVAALDRRTR
jgi:hypothetical protein